MERSSCSVPQSFPRDKESYYSAQNSYPYDNAANYCKEDGKNKSQFEYHKKEGYQNHAEYYRQATGSKIFHFHREDVLPVFLFQRESITNYNRSGTMREAAPHSELQTPTFKPPCPDYIAAATAVANDVVGLLMSLLS